MALTDDVDKLGPDRRLPGTSRTLLLFGSKGRPSVDPELLLMVLIVRYCCGIRSERRLRSIRQARCTSKHGGFPSYAYVTNYLKATGASPNR